MSVCVIRQAELADLPVILPLFDAYRRFYAMPADVAGASAYLRMRMERKESVILLAQDATGRAFGFCQMYFSFCSVAMAPIAILYDLFVDQAARGAGVGKLLLDAAESHAAHAGAGRIHLQTAQDNLIAQSLYEGAGWSRNTRFFGYAKALEIASV